MCLTDSYSTIVNTAIGLLDAYLNISWTWLSLRGIQCDHTNILLNSFHPEILWWSFHLFEIIINEATDSKVRAARWSAMNWFQISLQLLQYLEI
jgi:hypothetical protein